MGAFNPDTGCTLTTDLKAYWKLEEASGTRVDSIGSNDLTDNNTVTQATGIVGNAGQFTQANSEYLSIADNADLSTGNIDFTIACWVFADSFPTLGGFVLKSDGSASTSEYQLYASGAAIFFDWSNGTTFAGAERPNPGTSEWVFVVAWHDATANTVNVQLNNETIGSNSATGGNGSSTVFWLGQLHGSRFLNGRLDEVGIWKKVLTAQEKTDLYNSGAGNTFDSGGVCPPVFRDSDMLLMFD